MNATTQLDYAALPEGQSATIRLMLTLDAERQDSEKRPPLNLALVLDRSGSMAGDKLTRVKEAATVLANRLAGDDVLSLTVFDDAVDIIIAPGVLGSTHGVSERIASIRTGGRTFLSGGYLTGRDHARRYCREGVLSRIFLLTDGLANLGETSPQRLAALAADTARQGISTTTVGVGSDYNEHLLGAMAEQGGGSSYFIEKAEDAPGVFAEELGLIFDTVVTGCRVIFTPAVSGLTFAQLNTYPLDANGYLVGDLYGGQSRRLLLELTVPPLSPGKAIELGQVTVIGTNAQTGEKWETRLGITADTVNPSAFAALAPDRTITLEAAYLAVARAKSEAVRLAEHNDFRGAAELLDQYANALAGLALGDPALDAEIDDLHRRANRIRNEGAEYLSASERKRMHHESDFMAKSKLSSHQSMMSRRRMADSASHVAGGVTRYPCYMINNYIFAEVGNNRLLIDTALPFSFGDVSRIALGGQDFSLESDYLGYSAEQLGQVIGARFNVALGADIMAKFDVIIDISAGELVLAGGDLDLMGECLSTQSFMGAPIVEGQVAGHPLKLMVMSGTQLSYLGSDQVGQFPPSGEETDFYPGFGEFKSMVHLAPIQFGQGSPTNLKFGVLPGAFAMALGFAGASGILGSALFSTYRVHWSPRRNMLALERYRHIKTV